MIAKLWRIPAYFLPFTPYPYQGGRIDCPVCQNAESRTIAHIDRNFKFLNTVMCTRCGMVFTNPMPSEKMLNEFYADSYRFLHQGAVFRPRQKHIRKRRLEAEHHAQEVAEFITDGCRSLDFGCGSGELVQAMQRLGADAHAFEPGQAYGSFAQEDMEGRIRVGPYQSMHYARKFDLVTMWQVLEHLRDPLSALKTIVSWINPGAKVYIGVPNVCATPCKGFGWLYFPHVLSFNHWTLRLAAARCGLRPIKFLRETDMIFEQGTVDNLQELMDQGLALTTQMFVETGCFRSWGSYTGGKMLGTLGLRSKLRK